MIERTLVNKIIAITVKLLFSFLLVLFFISFIHIEATKLPKSEVDAAIERQREGIRTILNGGSLNNSNGEKNIAQWPPKMNQQYPDLDLLDKDGRAFKLSDLKGYVIAISYVDMSSLVSQAQAGAGVVGAYGTTKEIDKASQSFSDVVRKNAADGFTLPNDAVLEVYVLVYAQDGSQATLNDAEKWAQHFDLGLSRGVIVAVPQNDMRGSNIQSILAGYQLIDQHMMLRVDSAGPEPKHNLSLTLVPLLSKLVR